MGAMSDLALTNFLVHFMFVYIRSQYKLNLATLEALYSSCSPFLTYSAVLFMVQNLAYRSKTNLLQHWYCLIQRTTISQHYEPQGSQFLHHFLVMHKCRFTLSCINVVMSDMV